MSEFKYFTKDDKKGTRKDLKKLRKKDREYFKIIKKDRKKDEKFIYK